MRVEFAINNSTSPAARYLTWAPSPLRMRLLDAAPATGGVTVTLSVSRQANGGSVRYSLTENGTFRTTLRVVLPTNGTSVTTFVRGNFGNASRTDGDVSIVAKAGTTQLGTMPVMVRIRKNANILTAAERDRFVAAMAQLNNRGTGRFADFRLMHVAGLADGQAHGGPGFLPWHRAYLLDLERELQAIDPSVALPYWRFDRPSPNLFTPEFIGVPDALGTVNFAPSNPLQFWATDGVQGVARRLIGPDPATTASPGVMNEANTLALGSAYRTFRTMQIDPHGRAHTRYFGGSISTIPTAAKDPLFFLLHCNVDRLWAKWQARNNRFDAAVPSSYDSGPPLRLEGHNLGDSLWPWNGIVTPPRPSTAPGGALARSPCVSAPGLTPLVADMLDYKGVMSGTARQGFDYDDI